MILLFLSCALKDFREEGRDLRDIGLSEFGLLTLYVHLMIDSRFQPVPASRYHQPSNILVLLTYSIRLYTSIICGVSVSNTKGGVVRHFMSSFSVAFNFCPSGTRQSRRSQLTSRSM